VVVSFRGERKERQNQVLGKESFKRKKYRWNQRARTAPCPEKKEASARGVSTRKDAGKSLPKRSEKAEGGILGRSEKKNRAKASLTNT